MIDNNLKKGEMKIDAQERTDKKGVTEKKIIMLRSAGVADGEYELEPSERTKIVIDFSPLLARGARKYRSKELAQEIVEAPITGTIISIEVKVGDKVEEGDILLFIESMKMENPIMAPINGKVNEIKVARETGGGNRQTSCYH